MGLSFSTIKDAAASHPFVLIGGVAGVLLFWQLRSKSSSANASSAPSVYTMTADPNQIAAATATTNAQTAADVAQNQTNAALQLGLAQTAAAQAVADNQTTAYADIIDKQTAAAVQIAAINAGLAKNPTAAATAVSTVKTVGDIQHSLDSAASGSFGGQFGMSSANPNYTG